MERRALIDGGFMDQKSFVLQDACGISKDRNRISHEQSRAKISMIEPLSQSVLINAPITKGLFVSIRAFRLIKWWSMVVLRHLKSYFVNNEEFDVNINSASFVGKTCTLESLLAI
jgi:hypothetical protein